MFALRESCRPSSWTREFVRLWKSMPRFCGASAQESPGAPRGAQESAGVPKCFDLILEVFLIKMRKNAPRGTSQKDSCGSVCDS